MSAPVAPQAVRVYQSEVLDKPRISNIFVPCHVNKGGTIVSHKVHFLECVVSYCKACLVLLLYQMYLIRVRTRVASWNVQRRYREIHELHQQVGNLHYIHMYVCMYKYFCFFSFALPSW